MNDKQLLHAIICGCARHHYHRHHLIINRAYGEAKKYPLKLLVIF